jgi:carbon monoxide dehydrogenase subunit G
MKLLSIFSIFFILNCSTNAVAQKAVKVTAKGIPAVKSVKKTSPAVKTAAIHFAQTTIDLGTIKENAIVEKTFTFVNEGNDNLVILNAEGSCGCTVPTFSKTPIPPNGKGEIVVKYTAKNMMGPQKKTISVTTNGTPSIIKLTIEGWVNQIPGGVKD